MSTDPTAPPSATTSESKPTDAPDLAALARASQRSFLGEVFAWVREGRKWWLLPVLVVLGLLGGLVLLSSTAAAPFIYTLF